VGEAMAIGRTFKEALQKGIRSLEIGRHGLGADGADNIDPERLREKLTIPNADRIFYIRYALQAGMSIDAIADMTFVDRWFIKNIEQIVALEGQIRAFELRTIPRELMRRAKRWLWVAAESTCALFHLDAQRGLHGLQRLLGQDDRGNVLQARGIVISDRYGLYDRLPGEQRQLCWAHLKRDFTALAQGPPPQQQWGERLLKLEAAVFALWHQRRRHLPSLRRMLAPLQRRMHRLLQAGGRSGIAGVAGLCRYLLRQEQALWCFARVPGVAPTNNHAERMLRPAVQWRKQCLGSHSEQGCRFVERMLSAIQSCKLQGRSALQFCQDTLFAYRRGLPTPSLLPAPARTPSDH